MKPLDPDQNDHSGLRQALGRFATGVTIVTSVDAEGRPVGITANSFSSVSLEPPMVLWSLAKAAWSREAFVSASHFAVHVLTARQQELAERFARAGSDKFAGLEWRHGLGSVPVIDDFVARFQCRSVARHPAGDHIVFIGEVLDYEQNDERPLLFQGGRYALAERRMVSALPQAAGERRSVRPDAETGALSLIRARSSKR